MKRGKLFRLGILVGRFQTLHAGHEQLIGTAAALCEKVGVFVGSSQEEGTANNPFSYETRKKMLKKVFGRKIAVFPLPDIGVGNTATWGEYVLGKAFEAFGSEPDLLVSGRESRRTDWFSGEKGRGTAELYIPKTIEISATKMRAFLLEDDRKSWESYSNPALWEMYDDLRTEVIASENNRETKSV